MEMYLALTVTCFVSATIIPLSSEIIFFSAIYLGYDPWTCILLASLGNCAGVTFNYYLGSASAKWLAGRFVKFDQERLQKYALQHKRYGIVFLFASWLPVIGDPITIYAGIIRWPFAQFAAIAYSTRSVRYVVLYYLIAGMHLTRLLAH